MMLYVFTLIIVPNIVGLIFANIIYAFGYSLKAVQETNLLYDSTATRGGEGLYPKINSKGATGYYVLDGIASLVSGYLFVINGYIPMLICLAFTLISTLIATGFKDIYVNKFEQNDVSNKIKDYKSDFKISIKNIMNSNRLRALLIFMGLFNVLLNIMRTYRDNIFTDLFFTNNFSDDEKANVCLKNNVKIMIDDSKKNSYAVAKAGITDLLMDTEYNRDAKDLIRVHNWQEIYEYISNYKGKN